MSPAFVKHCHVRLTKSGNLSDTIRYFPIAHMRTLQLFHVTTEPLAVVHEGDARLKDGDIGNLRLWLEKCQHNRQSVNHDQT